MNFGRMALAAPALSQMATSVSEWELRVKWNRRGLPLSFLTVLGAPSSDYNSIRSGHFSCERLSSRTLGGTVKVHCGRLLFFFAMMTLNAFAQLQVGGGYTHLSGNFGLDGIYGEAGYNFNRHVLLIAQGEFVWDTSKIG